MQVSSSELLRWTNWDDQLWRRIKRQADFKAALKSAINKRLVDLG
jgi:hypothetical protein